MMALRQKGHLLLEKARAKVVINIKAANVRGMLKSSIFLAYCFSEILSVSFSTEDLKLCLP